jgi:hypothetical protein
MGTTAGRRSGTTHCSRYRTTVRTHHTQYILICTVCIYILQICTVLYSTSKRRFQVIYPSSRDLAPTSTRTVANKLTSLFRSLCMPHLTTVGVYTVVLPVSTVCCYGQFSGIDMYSKYSKKVFRPNLFLLYSVHILFRSILPFRQSLMPSLSLRPIKRYVHVDWPYPVFLPA